MSESAPLMLSVSGMRGLVGRSLTPAVAARYGSVCGDWLKRTRGGAHPHVVIGRDSRTSGLMYEAAVVSGLLAVGCRVTRVGVLSTPGIAVMVGELQADGGIVVTASHNPAPWNGIKVLRHDGVAPHVDEARDIIDAFEHDRFSLVGVEALATLQDDARGVAVHVRKVIEAGVDVAAIRAAKIKVVVDSVHGAGGDEAAALLHELGVEAVLMYREPTGLFPHPPEPTKENLTELCKRVTQHRAAVGFAQDTDADRLAIVDENGKYIGEEYTLALCAMHTLRKGDATAANLSTSRMIDDLAQRVGATVERSAVGEANVASAMRRLGAQIGGEGNGGIIWSKVSQVRDSLVGMALVLEMLAHRKATLSACVAEVPAYTIVKHKIDLAPGTDLRGALDVVAGGFKGERIDRQDGVRVDVDAQRAWVHVRASNTEPILRIIAEAPDQATAEALVERVRVMMK